MDLKRHGLLTAGIVAFVAMGLFAATPVAWISAGRPNESYPELLYLGLGLPIALIAIVAGALFAKFSSSRPKAALIPLRATASFALLVCGWLVVIGLGPKSPTFDAVVGSSLNTLFSFGLPVLVVALMVSVRIAARRPAAHKSQI